MMWLLNYVLIPLASGLAGVLTALFIWMLVEARRISYE